MKPFIGILVIAVGMLVSAGEVRAQRDLLVPAGTLLQCTLQEWEIRCYATCARSRSLAGCCFPEAAC